MKYLCVFLLVMFAALGCGTENIIIVEDEPIVSENTPNANIEAKDKITTTVAKVKSTHFR